MRDVYLAQILIGRSACRQTRNQTDRLMIGHRSSTRCAKSPTSAAARGLATRLATR